MQGAILRKVYRKDEERIIPLRCLALEGLFIYKVLAAYGHMGREDLGVSFEKTDMAHSGKRSNEL